MSPQPADTLLLRRLLQRLSDRAVPQPPRWQCRRAGYTVALELRQQPGGAVLEGRVAGRHDAVAIELARSDRPGAPSRLVSVDVQGRFRIDRLRPAHYRLVLRNWDDAVPLRCVDLRRAPV
ncbi:hypothetical protein ACPOLB_10340 [Rubrivivax sp. RP6-9]|uniref:hypothetical protein n=1 Tax=Rubrivivax sp. RP6-9 TaxID=3415750 RepID=UPI003CC66CD7